MTAHKDEESIASLASKDLDIKQEMGIQGVLGKVLADLTGSFLQEKEPASKATSDLDVKREEQEGDDASEAGHRHNVESPLWVVQFSALDGLTQDEVLTRLCSGQVLRGVALPFLELDECEISHPVVLENCRLAGLKAGAATFRQGITLRNCWVQERFVVSMLSKTFLADDDKMKGSVRFENCRFEGPLELQNVRVGGDVRSSRCFFAHQVVMKHSHIEGQVSFSSGTSHGLDLSRTLLNHHLFVSDMKMRGSRKYAALDLQKAKVLGGIKLQNCDAKANVDFSQSDVGENVDRALQIEQSTLLRMFLNQSVFRGDVKVQDSVVLGLLSALPPRAKHGQNVGRSAVFEGQVTFGKCQFKGKCLLQNTRFQDQVTLSHCLFENGASFHQATFAKGASFWKSLSHEGLHFRKARFQEQANFGHTVFADHSSFNDAVFQGEACFFETQMDGDVFFSGAYFAGSVNMTKLQSKGGLNLQNITVKGRICLARASVEGRLILSECELGEVYAPGLSIGSWGTLKQTTVHGDICLEGCCVGENLSPPAKDVDYVPGSLYMDSLVCKGRLRFANASIQGTLSLLKANVCLEVELMNSRVEHELILSSGFFREIVRCDHLRCGKAIVANLSRFRGEVSLGRMECERVELNGSSFAQGLTMRNASVRGVVSMNNVDVDGRADLSRCSFKQIFFSDLLADYFLIEREQLGEHLSSEEIGNYKQASNEYGILRQSFLVRNRYQDMDWAYYRLCRSKRKQKQNRWAKAIEWLVLDLGFGYGTRPLNVAGAALCIVLAFAGLFFWSLQGDPSPVGQTLQSLDLLNAIHLSVLVFASMDYSSYQSFTENGLKYYVALEGILGIFLITLFVATLSRKIIRT